MRRAWYMWAGVGLAVGIYEAWAVATHHPTMSQAVWHAPAWAAACVIGGLVYLIYHLLSGRKA